MWTRVILYYTNILIASLYRHSAKCWWNFSGVEVQLDILYLQSFPYLLSYTERDKKCVLYYIGGFFFYCWQRCAVCFFMVSFSESLFVEENEMAMHINIFKSNTARYDIWRGHFFKISEEIELVAIKWKQIHCFQLNLAHLL